MAQLRRPGASESRRPTPALPDHSGHSARGYETGRELTGSVPAGIAALPGRRRRPCRWPGLRGLGPRLPSRGSAPFGKGPEEPVWKPRAAGRRPKP